MKHLFFLLLCLIHFALCAQSSRYYPFTYIPQKKLNISNKVAISIDSSFNKRGKLIAFEHNEFNANGKVVYFNKNNKSETYYTYLNDSLLTDRIVMVKKDTQFVYNVDYNQFGKPIKHVWRKGNAKPYFVQLLTYDDQNRLIRYENRNKKNELIRYSELHYKDSGKVAEQRYYDKKGKLKSIYSFECNAKGEMLKSVKQVNYCTTSSKLNNGNYYEMEEATVGNKNYKRIYTFNPDSLLISYEFISDKGKAVSKVLYQYTSDKNMESLKVFKNDKFSFSNHYKYNAKGLKTEFDFINAKGNLQSKTKTHYVLLD